MMNIFHLLTFLLLSSHLPVASEPKIAVSIPVKSTIHPVEETSEYISWGGDRRLTWDDFLCEPKRNTDAVALTSTALGISYKLTNGELTYEISCSFSKVKSWGLLRTPYILAHEQGHFDITELFARKLYQALSEYELNKRTYRQDVSAIYNKIVKEKEALQFAYDGETDHSRNKALQQAWLEKINDLLTETEAFAAYP